MASAFEIYLRTGRRITPEAELETKFNPWHDPDDGRFTFAGQGRHFPGRTGPQVDRRNNGIRGRGGSFGGGGTSESWKPSPRPTKTTGPAVTDSAPRARSVAAPRMEFQPEAYVNIPENGYNFSIDAHARTRQVLGQLKLKSQRRSKRAQANAGKPDRRATDEGGHFIAARFDGPRAWFNHFAQDANFNRSEYRVLEDKWAKSIRSGKRVFVDIVPHYLGTSMRPHKLVVTWIINGEKRVRDFPNERRGR